MARGWAGTRTGSTRTINGSRRRSHSSTTPASTRCSPISWPPLTGDVRWSDLGQHARRFIEKTWNAELGFFYIGSGDGRTVNDRVLAVDVQAWTYLALLDRRYAAGLDWAKTQMATTDTPLSLNSSLRGNLRLSGVGYTDVGRRAIESATPSDPPPDPDAGGFTGNAQLAAALRARGQYATDLPTFRGDLATAAEYLA